MKITVDYPQTIERTVFRKGDSVMNPWHPENYSDRYVTISEPVNRLVDVWVNRKSMARMVQEEFMTNEDYSIEQTGMTPSAYQQKHKRAFNE